MLLMTLMVTHDIFTRFVYIKRFGSGGVGDIVPLFLPKKQKGPHAKYYFAKYTFEKRKRKQIWKDGGDEGGRHGMGGGLIVAGCGGLMGMCI